MSSLLFRLAVADYRERTRRFGFLLTLGITMWAAYMFLPPNDAQYTTMRFGEVRGLYNSAWVGTLVALLTGMFLGLAGFYLVKNSVTRDFRTRVGELLAATRITSGQYLLSKFLSNLFVLLSIVGVIMVVAGATQLIRGESRHLEPLKLCLPFVLGTLPMMAWVAGLAVLFETVRWLRGGLGNFVYYILWTLLLVSAIPQSGFPIHLDPAGMRVTVDQITADCRKAMPASDTTDADLSVGINVEPEGQRLHLTTFEWEGVHWSPIQLVMRGMWLFLALGLLWPARLFFDRHAFASPNMSGTMVKSSTGDAAESVVELQQVSPDVGTGERWATSFLSGATGSDGRFRLFGLVLAELKLAMKGTSIWWYIVALGVWPACLFAPWTVVRSFVFPLAWIWPILKWSPLGTRELECGTDQILYSSPSPLWHQLPARWLAGVLIAFAAGGAVGVRWLIAGDVAGVGSWIVGAMFVPTLALFCGSLTGTSKLFEILYLILWYAGPLNGLPALDYMGTTTDAVRGGVPLIYLGITALLAGGILLVRTVRLSR